MARQANGKFGPGNPGGPGRPRRATELAYLATMGKSVSLEDWKEITLRAVADAKAGDAKARDWLSRHLVGDEPLALASVVKELEDLKALVSNGKHAH